jgi:hypothetical protein
MKTRNLLFLHADLKGENLFYPFAIMWPCKMEEYWNLIFFNKNNEILIEIRFSKETSRFN